MMSRTCRGWLPVSQSRSSGQRAPTQERTATASTARQGFEAIRHNYSGASSPASPAWYRDNQKPEPGRDSYAWFGGHYAEHLLGDSPAAPVQKVCRQGFVPCLFLHLDFFFSRNHGIGQKLWIPYLFFAYTEIKLKKQPGQGFEVSETLSPQTRSARGPFVHGARLRSRTRRAEPGGHH